MRRSRILALTGAVALATTALGATATSAGAAITAPMTSTSTSEATSYLVLAKEGVSTKDLSRTLSRAGATVNHTNEAVGLVTVTSTDANFAARARALDGVKGAAADRSIGRAPVDVAATPDPVEKEHVLDRTRANGSAKDVPAPPEGADPLDGLLWGHEMVDAFAAREVTTGDKVSILQALSGG